ncbi:MAG: PhoX family phosphatase [Ignavibacteriae bacterium]|nr:PhoX family phosphatase [Ignavibacteriota bacterium]
MRLEDLIHKKISRRNLLKRSGKAAAFLTAGSVLPNEFFELSLFKERKRSDQNEMLFKPIEPTDSDNFILPQGFDYKIIRKWGDKINESEYFGYNNDFVGYMPIDLLAGGNDTNDGLLVINHEYPSPLFINNYTDEDFKKGKIKTPEEVNAEQKSVGISVIRVKRENGVWNFIEDEKYNRRIDSNTIHIVCGNAKTGLGETVTGTLANCSGGITPWGTYLSGEENFQDYFASKDVWEYRWNDVDKNFNDEQYGWVVEIDPFDRDSVPKKRTSLGRFRHENVAIGISPGGRVVAYMGDDKVNECVYKFISKNTYDPDKRELNMDILDEGDLYVADFENGKWQLLDYDKRPELKSDFASQSDVLINCDKASKLVGGTECNRPEDIEINPVDRSLFVSFTNNSTKDDYYGGIVRIIEKNNDPESLEFDWEVFATGGVESGFSCPDNLTFDSKGNLWVLCDVSTSKINKGRYAPFKNNSMFMIPTSGPDKGKAFRFASGPVDSELCGGNFSPDESTMFISVQHPGEGSLTMENPTSRWPDYGNDIPRPAVIAVTGFKK